MKFHQSIRFVATRFIVTITLLPSALAAQPFYNITYTDLGSLGGSVSFFSSNQQVGTAVSITNSSFAAIWSGSPNSVINLNPPGALYSNAQAGSGEQQGGQVSYDDSFNPCYAALWSGSAASFRNLSPPGAVYSGVYGMSSTQQVGEVYYGAPSFHTAPALWHGTAGSFIDLTPAGYQSGIAWAVAKGQQAGIVFPFSHAAVWSGTAASFRDLHPTGASSSEIFATTGTQQAGWASFGDPGHAGLWSGSAKSFVDLNPIGASWSQARATIGNAQAGFAVFGPVGTRRHAVIWFGSATQFIDLNSSLPAQIYVGGSEARSLWSDGTNIFVGGVAHTRGYSNPIIWMLTRLECSLTCPTNIILCSAPGQCGAVVHFDLPSATNCEGSIITCIPPSGSFFPTGTNTVQCIATNAAGQVTDTCSFEVIVRDCEPPVVQSIAASPNALWPPNHKMRAVTVNVSATDNCHVARCKIVSVTSSESTDKHGGGNAAPDWEITGDLTLNLRAERSGNGTGRVYRITIECADDSGNASTATAQVYVSHSSVPVSSIRRAGGDFVLSWHAISNRTYRVQYTEDLSANNWTDLPGDVCATNDLASKTDTTCNGAQQRFYRVLQLP